MFVPSKINGNSPKESNNFNHFTKHIETKGVIPIWMKKNTIQLFEDQAIRTAWDEEQQAPIGRF